MTLTYIEENCNLCLSCETQVPGVIQRLKTGAATFAVDEIGQALMAYRACKNSALELQDDDDRGFWG